MFKSALSAVNGKIIYLPKNIAVADTGTILTLVSSVISYVKLSTNRLRARGMANKVKATSSLRPLQGTGFRKSLSLLVTTSSLFMMIVHFLTQGTGQCMAGEDRSQVRLDQTSAERN
jgi:hypothetical protein